MHLPHTDIAIECASNADDIYVLLKKIGCIARNSTTSFLTATTLRYTIGAGITAAAGTRLALQSHSKNGLHSTQLDNAKANSIFLVTTSLNQDWVIYAPAAYRGCGSRFSGSLSGIEP
jgi:hypothetical protein